MKLKLAAHAKINLTLKVLGKRDDGYHELETIMQSLELHDDIYIEPCSEDIQFTVDGDAPSGQDNLVYRAAALLKEYAGSRQGCRIHLVKRIPMAAGLAGGSTDAAAALRGLNKLWELGLDKRELLKMAEKLGADVPFCLIGGTALARGKGEILTPLPKAPRMGVVLVKPFFGVPTAEVFRRFSDTALKKSPNTGEMIAAIEGGNFKAVAENLGNDLESVTMEMYPQLQDIKKQLKAAGARGVLMSGSGPTIFGLAKTVEEAQEIAAQLKIPGAHVIPTATP